jgi:hypothetical protein
MEKYWVLARIRILTAQITAFKKAGFLKLGFPIKKIMEPPIFLERI